MNIHKLYSRFFLPLLLALMTVATAGCSDDDNESLGGEYGYVQFKLYKAASFDKEAATRAATDKLEALNDAKKIKVVMEYNGTTVSQTMPLNAYNAENAEFGLRSDKLQLLTGTYTVIGYYLYDAVDELLLAGPGGDDNTFTVVNGGLQVKPLAVDAVEQGMVKFKLTKEGLPQATTRTAGEYLFSSIRLVDVTVTNTFNRVSTTFTGLKVTYEEDYVENNAAPDDKYMDIGTAKCDSAVWLPAGTYQVTSYTTYSQTGSVKTELETQAVKGEAFVVTDNDLTEEAVIPVQLSETSEYIKDYKALKAIWESLGGENWSFYGDAAAHGTNWNFNREIDMWGDQPGVTLDNKGRVIGLVLAGFGAQGTLPDAIGQLTELQVLNLGSHDEKIGGHLFADESQNANMSEERKREIRYHYEENFLKYDPRANMSEMIIESVNRNPAQKRIETKGRVSLSATQIGTMTNRVTKISRAIYRLSKLQQLYLGNGPIEAGNVGAEFTDADNPDSPYRVYSEEAEGLTDDELWANLTELTDLELYNCPKLTAVPEMYFHLPAVQAFNLACNQKIEAKQLEEDLIRMAEGNLGKTLQILYLSNDNLEVLPAEMSNIKKLGLLDLSNNNVHTLNALGTDIRLASLYLDNNQITEIPANFCSFAENVETLTFSHNKLTKIPNIFDASSVHVMGSVDFSYNEITGVDLDNGEYKGINASTVTISYNKFENFPTELFAAGSPITTLDISNNLMTKIPKGVFSSGKAKPVLNVIDLRFNKLTELSGDFEGDVLPALTNIDLSYNCFSKFPYEPLRGGYVEAFAIRHQRDAKGNRTLREWPTGITVSCPSLMQFQIGSNDIRKVDETLTSRIYILDIADNPNISIDVTSVCSDIMTGLFRLFYDKTQDIRGCDALDLE